MVSQVPVREKRTRPGFPLQQKKIGTVARVFGPRTFYFHRGRVDPDRLGG